MSVGVASVAAPVIGIGLDCATLLRWRHRSTNKKQMVCIHVPDPNANAQRELFFYCGRQLNLLRKATDEERGWNKFKRNEAAHKPAVEVELNLCSKVGGVARDPDGPNRCTSAYFTYQIYSLHVPCRALVRIPPVKLFSSSRTLAEEIRDPSATSEGRSVAVDRIDSTSTHTVVRPGGREAEEVRGRTYVRGRSEEGCPRSSRLRALALNLRSAVDLSWCSSCGSGLTATKLVCSGAW